MLRAKLIGVSIAVLATVTATGCKKKKNPGKDAGGVVVVTDAAVVTPTDDIVRIGVIHSATGDLAPFGEPVGEGLKLALEEINAAGGINKKKVEFIIEDDGSDPERAVKAFEKLAGTDKVVAVIGPTSADATRATAPIAAKHGIVQITPTAHESDLAELPNTFVIFPTVEQVSDKVAKLATGRLKGKKIAVLNPANKWGEQSTAALRKSVAGSGGELAVAESFQEGSTDFNEQLRKIAAAKPDVLVFPAYYETETLAIAKTVVSNAAFRDIIIIIVGAACRVVLQDPILDNPAFRRNIYFVDEGGTFAIPGNERSMAFNKTFNEKFQHAPSPYAAAAHAAVFAVKDAIETGATGAKVADALRSTKTVTAFGQLDFSGKAANVGASIELLQVNADKQLNLVQ